MPLVEIPTPHDSTNSHVFIVDFNQEQSYLDHYVQVRNDF